MKQIQTVGRRRLVVFEEDGHIKIEILLVDRHLATLDLEPDAARELVNQIMEAITQL